MKEVILLYRLTDAKRRAKVVSALLPLRLRIKTVHPEEYNHPLGYLAGLEDFVPSQTPYTGDDLPQEMMVMAGLSSQRVDAVLRALVKNKAGHFPYKAILTETNKNWTSTHLFHSIAAEREHMLQQKEKPNRE